MEAFEWARSLNSKTEPPTPTAGRRGMVWKNTRTGATLEPIGGIDIEREKRLDAARRGIVIQGRM